LHDPAVAFTLPGIRRTKEGEHRMSAALQLQSKVSDAEWRTRCELAALYRIIHDLGWTDLTSTHMSARIPGEPDHFLINNYGEMFDEITASSLIKMDMDGNVLTQGGSYNNAGFTIHSGVYKARPDANCVLHTHTRAGAGVSLLRRGLRPISQDSLHVIDDVVYHEYGVPATPEECEALGRTCAKGSCVVLLNHGLLTLGETIHGTFMRLYMLERACELELIARQMDEPPVVIDEYIQRKAAERMKKVRSTKDYGLNEWQGLVRTVERKGADFRR
jgi:ribulose-5-phosphate 4-epimerase/fuculose-1-phosphate aldolase